MNEAAERLQLNPSILASGSRRVDACAALAAVEGGRIQATELVEAAEAAAASPACAHAFVRRFIDQARTVAKLVTRGQAAGLPLPPLAGLPVSVKDVFDIAGQPTTAGSPTLSHAAAALDDAPVVARLRRAGAVLMGHTNMTEFAYSGLGLNPHFGTPVNPITALLDPATRRIPGGSTSGGAVSVACGAAWAALGTDTGGSLRIPAALHGLVGFKPTQRRVPRKAMLPLSPTLDTAGAITLSVRDAIRLDRVLAGETESPPPRAKPARAWRLAIPSTLMLDGLDTDVARAFEQAVARLAEAGAQVETIPLPLLAQVADLQAGGGIAAAEAWAWHRGRLGEMEEEYDPRVASRIRKGADQSAADYIDRLALRRDWIEAMTRSIDGYDALLSPTVPMIAPALAPLEEHETRYFAVNSLMLRNPSVVNLLDGCALSLPCHAPGQMPVGLMAWAPGGRDTELLSLALTIEAVLQMAQRQASGRTATARTPNAPGALRDPFAASTPTVPGSGSGASSQLGTTHPPSRADDDISLL